MISIKNDNSYPFTQILHENNPNYVRSQKISYLFDQFYMNLIPYSRYACTVLGCEKWPFVREFLDEPDTPLVVWVAPCACERIFDGNITDQDISSKFMALNSFKAHTSWGRLKCLGLWHRLIKRYLLGIFLSPIVFYMDWTNCDRCNINN